MILHMFAIPRRKQVRVEKTDIICGKTAAFTAIIVALQEGCMADQDPQGLYLAQKEMG